MNLLASYFKKIGKTVSGSDIAKSNVTKHLQNNGIKVYYRHHCNNIDGADLVVINGAIKPTNPEYAFALQNKICILDRADILNYVCFGFKHVIAIAGTHGKTTTCAMLYNILKEHTYKTSCHIGGEVSNERFERGDDFLVIEACEYNKSFLHLHYDTAIVLNVEKDHLDSYGGFKNLKKGFAAFLQKAKHKIVCGGKTTEYLSDSADEYVLINAKNAKIKSGLQYFDYAANGINETFEMCAYGRHNISNAIIAINCALSLGVKIETIKVGLKKFENVKRRFEIMGTHKKNVVINDYAHHPTEIHCFLTALKQRYKLPVVCVFQPHTFSRTRLLFKDFIKVLSTPCQLILFKEYAARENHASGKSAFELFEEMKKSRDLISYAENEIQLKNQIKLIRFKKYILAFVGAGDIVGKIAKVVVFDKK